MLTSGAASFTNTLAVDVLPVPPFVELTCTEFALRPAVLPVTSTESAQEAPAVKLTPVKLTVEEPAVAVAVPPQLFDKPFGVATTNPPGKVSIKVIPVSVVAELGLLIEKVRLVGLPVKMGFAVKDLAMTGGAITVSDEVPYPVEVVFGPVSVEVMVPLIFVYCPATLPNTFTEIVQLAFAERVAPLRLIMEVPAVAVVVPPVSVPTVQVVVKPFGVATNRPVGRVSEKPTPVNAVAVLGLVSVNLRVLELP